MTRAWRWPLAALTTAAAVTALAGGCEADGTVLWRQGAGGHGGSVTVGGRGGGGDVSTTSGGPGGDYPPPPGGAPPFFECPPDIQPCPCPEGEACMCTPSPNGPPQCDVQCVDNNCQFDCDPKLPNCSFSCSVGCSAVCHAGSDCNMICEGDCTLACLSQSSCTLWSWGGPSQMFCDFGAICDCTEQCVCTGPGCPPPP